MFTISHVLCPVDFSDTSRRALDHAAAFANWYGARLTVLHVVPRLAVLEGAPAILTDAERAAIGTTLDRFVAVVPPGVPVRTLIVESLEVHREIAAQARATGADLVVLGSHGRSGLSRLVLGSVTEQALRITDCPVLVVTASAGDPAPAAPVRFQRIVCAVDFSAESTAAVGYALALGQENDASVALVHAISPIPVVSEQQLSPAIEQVAHRLSEEHACLRQLRTMVPDSVQDFCHVELVVRTGAADDVILAVAKERQADLIVTAVRARGPLSLALFGTTTGHVVRATPCPLLVVHGERRVRTAAAAPAAAAIGEGLPALPA